MVDLVLAIYGIEHYALRVRRGAVSQNIIEHICRNNWPWDSIYGLFDCHKPGINAETFQMCLYMLCAFGVFPVKVSFLIHFFNFYYL